MKRLQVQLGQTVLLRASDGRYLRATCTYIGESVAPPDSATEGSYGVGARVLQLQSRSPELTLPDNRPYLCRLDGTFADSTQAVPLTEEEEAVWRLTGKGPGQ